MEKFLQIFVIMLTLLITATACQYTGIKFPPAKPSVLGDLAYDRNKQFGYTVYLEEGSKYTPFLVLTAAYAGNEGRALLLRKDLCDEPRYFDDNRSSYYDSQIDWYLNNEYMRSLGKSLQEVILNTDIEVVNYESIYSTKLQYDTISRRVFLLSSAETGYPQGHAHPYEGKPLSYFLKGTYAARTAYKNGIGNSWWLRTPFDGSAVSVGIVTAEGAYSDVTLDIQVGVRPAFCLNADTPLIQIQLGSNLVYVLKLD